MFFIICNEKQKIFFKNLISLSFNDIQKDICIISDENKLEQNLQFSNIQPSSVIIEILLDWNGRKLQDFYGLDIAAYLRREKAIKYPFLFFSGLKKTFFEKVVNAANKFSIINAEGSDFLSYPFTINILKEKLTKVENLTDITLHDVVINYCGLQEKWRKTAHDFSYTILKYKQEYEEARRIFNEWVPTIEHFAPEQKENLGVLQKLLELPPSDVATNELINAYKKLKIGLELSQQITSEIIPPESDFGEKEKQPPMFYSKVLVANDELNLPLPDFLKTNYGYDVLKQATNPSEAERIFLSEQPEVVIADYYFKTSDDGMKFIEFVTDKKHKWQPLVLVNSFRDLSNIDFPAGVINCSGEEAHNPKFIHAQIWKAVREDVEDPEPEKRADLTEGVSSVEDYCRRILTQNIILGLQFGISRWRKFSEDAVKYSINLLRGLISNGTNNNEKHLINKLLEVIEPFEFDHNFSYTTVKNLVGMVRSLHKEIDQLPITNASNILHLIGHTFLSYSLSEIEYSLDNLVEVINQLNGMPKYKKILNKVTISVEKFQSRFFYLQDAENILKNADNLFQSLPKLSQEGESKNQSKKQIRIVVVEDDQLYRENFVIPVIEDVRSALKGKGYEIKIEPFENTDEALNSIPVLDKARLINIKEMDSSKTLAIVDLYLPKIIENLEHSENNTDKRIKLTNPEKQNGLALIKALRDPNRNIPVIVFSTSGDDKDRRDIQRLGVSQKNHINKRGVNSRKTLFDALIRNITKNDQYYIEEIEEGGKTTFCINDVPIKLDNSETEILKSILKLSLEKPRFNANDVLNLLNKRIAENSVKKIISSIRKKIQKSLALNAITVGKDDIIATVASDVGKKSSYRLLADVKAAEYDEQGNAISKNSFKVLIVENDLQTLSYISTSLETISKIKIEQATNVEDAIEKAKSFRPDIISLDLDIPRTREAFAKNPEAGDRNAGLDALAEIKLDSSNIKVILTSTFFNDRILRDRAAQLGISNENIVPKFENSDWINSLIHIVKHLGSEAMSGKKGDVLSDVPEPRIEILDGCNIEAGILRLKVNGNFYAPRKSQQAQIIGLLIKNANKTLTYNKIKQHLNLNKVTDNNRRTWASRIREDIRNLWLCLPESEFLGAEDHILENFPEKGMILHAHILNPAKLK